MAFAAAFVAVCAAACDMLFSNSGRVLEAQWKWKGEKWGGLRVEMVIAKLLCILEEC